MRKFFIVLFSIFLLLNFSACGESKPEKERNFLAGQTLKFSGTDLEGKKATKDLFKDYDLIIINKWGTFCSPCIKEMPDIQKIQDEFKDKKVKVIGVISMKPEDDEKSLVSDAKKITKIKNITYLNVLPDKKLNEQLNKFEFVPVTLFVKPDGKVLNTYIVGASNYDYLKKLTESALKGELK